MRKIIPGVPTPKANVHLANNSFGSSQVQFCNGGYIARSGCYPFCPSASGWGCDTGTQGGSNPLGLTQNYTVTTGDVSSGNTSTRAYSPVIDPYQRITPNMLSYSGGYSNMDGGGISSYTSIFSEKNYWIGVAVGVLGVIAYQKYVK